MAVKVQTPVKRGHFPACFLLSGIMGAGGAAAAPAL
jgi:hypothetical protein